MGKDKKFLYPDEIGNIELLNTMGTDKCITDSARVSFLNDTPERSVLEEKDVKLIHYLAKNKHTTPFEHCTMTFRIKVPLFVAKQHMRHRTWSFNEVSRRYTSKGVEFYLPTTFRTQHKKNRQASNNEEIDPVLKVVEGSTLTYITKASDLVRSVAENSFKLYETMLEKGICREQARMILPQCMYTEYWATSNLLNILKFLKLRLPEDSQWEIRRLAEEMGKLVKNNFPEAYKACIDMNLV